METSIAAEQGRRGGRAAPSGLGTFAGVFTPSVLTILGMVLFLRLGFVVGNAGLERALLIIGAANAVSLVTALSMSAIATNLRVKGGGDYYLISRTLGPAFGGALGLVLFLAQAVSIGFYCIGFAEAAVPLLGLYHPLAPRVVGLLSLVALCALVWAGADLATRFQYVVMGLLVAGVASFAAGAATQWDGALLARNLQPPALQMPFWVLFAVFFPAVTGFTQGVSMSGDLANPGRSIPRGVLGAVVLSAAIYFGVAVLFAAGLPLPYLQGDMGAMRRLAAWGPLVDMGVLAATLSSALASFMGAPRILQALARDQVFPWLSPLAAVQPGTNNPRRAIPPTLAVAVGVVLLGELDLVAAVVSMFFLLSYGLLNYATWYEARSGSPSFRPSFRWYHPGLALAGAAACVGAMVAIDVASGLFAVGVVYVVYRSVARSGAAARWADGRRAFHLQAAREHLLAAAAEPEHPRSWRPQLLVFSDSPGRRAALLRFSHWIEAGAGVATVVRMIEGDLAEAAARRSAMTEALARELHEQDSAAFPLVLVGKDTSQMVATLVQACGVGPLRVNTTVVNWPETGSAFFRPLGLHEFGNHVAMAFRLGTNLLLLDSDAQAWERLHAVAPADRVIDVWWRDNRTGELMLLLAYLMTRSDDWRRGAIRLVCVPEAGQEPAQAERALAARLDDMRIPATVVVAPGCDEEAVVALSRASTLVFLPFRIHGGRFYSPFGWELGAALPRLPVAVLALAAQDIGLQSDPDMPAGDAPADAAPAG